MASRRTNEARVRQRAPSIRYSGGQARPARLRQRRGLQGPCERRLKDHSPDRGRAAARSSPVGGEGRLRHESARWRHGTVSGKTSAMHSGQVSGICTLFVSSGGAGLWKAAARRGGQAIIGSACTEFGTRWQRRTETVSAGTRTRSRSDGSGHQIVEAGGSTTLKHLGQVGRSAHDCDRGTTTARYSRRRRVVLSGGTVRTACRA